MFAAVRVRGAVAGQVRAAQDPDRLRAELHIQDVLLPVHQLLPPPHLHCHDQG